MTPIGQAPQLQPNLIQSAPQQVSQKPVQQQQSQSKQNQSIEFSENKNFQKLAEDILAKRSSGEVTQKPAIERGQVLDLVI